MSEVCTRNLSVLCVAPKETIGGNMKKFIVYLLVIILTVSLGFAVFYLVRDNEIISISHASIYKDAGDSFTLDVNHVHKKSYTTIQVSSSNESIVSSAFNTTTSQINAIAKTGGVARINVRTSNEKFRNLWCDVIVGDGTVESPYYISTAEQLAAIGMGQEIETTDEQGNKVGTGVYAGAGDYAKYHSNLCYKLIDNINAADVNNGYWVPLRNFTGRFDGNGYTIANVYIDIDGYKNAFGDEADAIFINNKKAGLFESIGSESVVYNFKMSNYIVKGGYNIFGAIAAENSGTIERIEVKDLTASVSTNFYGGIVGTNTTAQAVQVTKTKDDGTTYKEWERQVARIDRCSVNQIAGIKYNSTTGAPEVMGLTGTIGGLVGVNKGGVVIYSYTVGEMYFGDDSVRPFTYGGVVGHNIARNDMFFNSSDPTENAFQGASIKDCYSNLRATFIKDVTNGIVGGVIGQNDDAQNGYFDDDVTQYRANNYLIGLYYNKDNLNYTQENMTKNFGGIGKFTITNEGVTHDVQFEEKETIVYGLTTEELRVAENFVSHITKDVEFNDDGVSQGVVEKEVLWLFGTVWAIDSDINDGMPHLNYQVVYVPDDFATVGVPIVPSTLNNFYYVVEVEYPVYILSDNGKVRIKVRDYHQLVYSPTGIDLTWESDDTSIVEVDQYGKLYGVKAGVTTVTATTKTGNEAVVTVIVENIPYIINVEDTIYMYTNAEYDLDKITVDPAPSGTDVLSFEMAANSYVTLDRVNNTLVAGDSEGEAILTIRIADTVMNVRVVVVEAPSVSLTASPSVIDGYISNLSKTGTINIIANGISDKLNYTYTFLSGAGVVDLAWDTNDSSKLNYTINSVGSAVVRVTIHGGVYDGKGQVDIHFNIKEKQQLTLNLSSTTITGYYSSMNKRGSVTVSNSANRTLQYSAESSNTNVVEVSMNGNAVEYQIKAVGNAVVTVNIINSQDYYGTAYITFKILQYTAPADSVTLNKTDITMFEGDSYALTASGTYSKLTWTSLSTGIATVDQNGVVSAKVEGTTTIVVKTSNGAEARCIVRVKKMAPEITYKISVSPSSITLENGASTTLKASGTYSSVSWSSSSSLVSVSQSGKITAASSGTGTAKITATAKDENGNARAYAYCTVTVVAKTVTVSVSASSSHIYIGNTVTFTAKTSGGTVVWTILGTGSIVSTSGNTCVVKGTGTGTITAKATLSGVTARRSVVVSANTASYSQYVYSAEQLNAVRNNPDKTYYIAGNIDLGSEENWEPIGTVNEPFTGTISALYDFENGSYFTISNVNCENTERAGIFGYTEGANISNIVVAGESNFSGTTYAGAIVAEANNTQIKNCSVETSSVTAERYAGGIVGYMNNASSTDSCAVDTTTVSATKLDSCAGGVAGYATGSSSYNDRLNSSNVRMTLDASGYVGGIFGKMHNASVGAALVEGETALTAGSSYNDYVGGIAGYSDGNGDTLSVYNSTVKSGVISGHYSGGIIGGLNATRPMTLKFNNYKNGYSSADLDASSTYVSAVDSTAVREGVNIKGANVGGLVGILNAGAVTNCYARATLTGTSNDAIKAGFTANTNATNFNNQGGTGSAGLIRFCYTACTFEGAGSNYAITRSAVHDYTAFGDGAGRPGFCMDYLFDSGVAGKANYDNGGNFLSGDKVQSQKSTHDMKTSTTYLGKGFDAAVWSLEDNRYATLKTER